MKKLLNKTKVIFLIIVSLMIFACGGDDSLPFWINAYDSTIDLSNPGEDGRSMVTATVFDSQGNPNEDGTMFFTLNDSARGYFIDDDGLRVHSVGVELDDGVAEVSFFATNTPETVVVTAYCPWYPLDNTVSTSISVINGTFEADYSYFVADKLVTFHDESGFDDAAGQSIVLWEWDFDGDGTYDYSGSTIHYRDFIWDYSGYGLAVPPDGVGPWDTRLRVTSSDGTTSTIFSTIVIE